MNLIWNLGFGLLLIFIIVEDFRFRAISWWSFPLLVIAAMGIEYWNLKLHDIIVNSCFTFIQLIMLSLYFSIKEKKVINITRDYLGWGDILLWIISCLLFSPLNFLLFFMGSLVFTMIIVAFWKLTKIKPVMSTVPLAGIQAMALLLVLIVTIYADKISFRNDGWIEKFLVG
jgi:hypothetical protein